MLEAGWVYVEACDKTDRIIRTVSGNLGRKVTLYLVYK